MQDPDSQLRIGHFIEDVCQAKRIHSALGYLTPAEFETAYWERSMDTPQKVAQNAPKEWGLLHCRVGGGMGDDVRLHAKWNFADYLYHAFTIYGMEGHLELSGDIGGEELSPGRSTCAWCAARRWKRSRSSVRQCRGW
jgi:hypothetical protein